MTRRIPCPPAPGPLEDYARQFDDLLANVAQRRACRAYLQGLLLPRERNKTLTGLAGTEPVLGAQAAPAQRLQWFLSESSWDASAVNERRLTADRPNVAWPVALRRVQAWLQPWTLLVRWWHAWSAHPPPPPLQALLDALWLGQSLDCYVR